MKTTPLYPILIALLLLTGSCSSDQPEAFAEEPDLTSPKFLQEVDGFVEVEAEDYHRKSANNSPREWYLIAADSSGAHAVADQAASASAEQYMEGLPDTRVTHDDSLIVGTNFFPEAGVGPLLEYDVTFNTAGRYIVWARAHSTGTEDNGIHVGINGEWPEGGSACSGARGKAPGRGHRPSGFLRTTVVYRKPFISIFPKRASIPFSSPCAKMGLSLING